MKLSTLMLTALVMTMPLAAQAARPDHSVSPQTLSNDERIVQDHARRQNLAAPDIVEYRYGMKLDVARIVFKSPLQNTCEVAPRLMIYKDSRGALNALQYRAMSECRNNT